MPLVSAAAAGGEHSPPSVTVLDCKISAGTRWESFSAAIPDVCGERSLPSLPHLLSIPSLQQEKKSQSSGTEGTPCSFGQGRAVEPPSPLVGTGQVEHSCFQDTPKCLLNRKVLRFYFLHCCGMAAPGEAVPEPTSLAALPPTLGAATWLRRDTQEDEST